MKSDQPLNTSIQEDIHSQQIHYVTHVQLLEERERERERERGREEWREKFDMVMLSE